MTETNEIRIKPKITLDEYRQKIHPIVKKASANAMSIVPENLDPNTHRIIARSTRRSAQLAALEKEDELNETNKALSSTRTSLLGETQRRKEAEEMAMTDHLTGLINRRAYEYQINLVIQDSIRHKSPFGLLILDSDNLKDINNQYGHNAGDEYLRKLAKIISSNVRTTDIAARIGGDEIGIIFPETDPEIIEARAEKIRSTIEETLQRAMSEGENGINISKPLTASIGFSVWDPKNPNMTAKDLFEEADAALYVSKDGRDGQPGRNKTTKYEPKYVIYKGQAAITQVDRL